MNPNPFELQHELDLLVDGELPSDRWSPLFTQLDLNPAGWKQLALRYLESQVVGTTLRNTEFLPLYPPSPDPNRLSTMASSPLSMPRIAIPAWRRAVRRTVFACTWFAAFALGWLLHASPDVSTTTRIADARSAPSQARQSDSVPSGPHPVGATARGLANDLPVANTPTIPRGVPIEESINAEDLTPIVGSTLFDLRNWWQQASAFPDDLRSKLQQNGHRIHRDIHLVPIATQGGGWGIVPIERLEITPASDTYSVQ